MGANPNEKGKIPGFGAVQLQDGGKLVETWENSQNLGHFGSRMGENWGKFPKLGVFWQQDGGKFGKILKIWGILAAGRGKTPMKRRKFQGFGVLEEGGKNPGIWSVLAAECGKILVNRGKFQGFGAFHHQDVKMGSVKIAQLTRKKIPGFGVFWHQDGGKSQ